MTKWLLVVPEGDEVVYTTNPHSGPSPILMDVERMRELLEPAPGAFTFPQEYPMRTSPWSQPVYSAEYVARITGLTES